jgi:hypothetical protein
MCACVYAHAHARQTEECQGENSSVIVSRTRTHARTHRFRARSVSVRRPEQQRGGGPEQSVTLWSGLLLFASLRFASLRFASLLCVSFSIAAVGLAVREHWRPRPRVRTSFMVPAEDMASGKLERKTPMMKENDMPASDKAKMPITTYTASARVTRAQLLLSLLVGAFFFVWVVGVV